MTYAAVTAPVTAELMPPFPEVPCTLFGTSTALMAKVLAVEPAGQGSPELVVIGGRAPVTEGGT
jgi:hypothetical protein